jgi:tryptophan 2,3-dioxygenase
VLRNLAEQEKAMTIASIPPICAAKPFGVGLGNQWAQTAPDHLSAASADLGRWQQLQASAGFRWPAHFPYTPLLDYFRSVGRNTADAGLVSELQLLQRSVAAVDSEARVTGDAELLALWLPMTFDTTDGTYDSYIGAQILESLTDRLGIWSTGQVIDTVAAAVLADLVLIEAEALESDVTSKRQVARVRAAVQALHGTAGFAPDARNTQRGPLTALPTSALDLIDVAQDIAAAVLDASPDCVRRCVTLTLVPTTAVHDELMFIRSIQAFECVYQQIARCVDIAIDEILGGDPAAAVAELHDASARLAATSILYRLVTTMPKDSFAVIRGATDGRSAIQSRAYNRVEQLCTRSASSPPAATPVRPTVEEVVHQRQEELGPFFTLSLTAAMQTLDQAWGSMKRTHWGIALKIIGRVPGTGGTAGADYLQVKSHQPLFPALTPCEDRAS